MTFLNREDAGARLGRHLIGLGIAPEYVLALPRGGVVVAAEISRLLNIPLDVIVVRKVGHPRFREFAVGALAEPDVVLLDNEALSRTHVSAAELQEVIAEEQQRLQDYRRRFHLHPLPSLAQRMVILVDDGLATGASMEAAVKSVRELGAGVVIVAVPVASDNGVARLEKVADLVIALLTDPAFDAVGRYYEQFDQTTDDQVLAHLSVANP